MAIQIGKYKRPGIFIEEFDNSVITSPTVQGVTSMILGFSKKGPVNTPVLLQNTNDLESIFGSIDRNLERKGNFFHRTISKMLESTPVYAINLLLTDDTLDKIEYQSLSAATDKSNDVEQVGAYRRFFDTTGFWKRDTESFIDLTKSNVGYNSRVLNFTNLSDRYITTFVFKTRMSGFDRTLIEWYGSVEKMPTYVNQTDYASDYMVDVIVVGGDWSNYQELSIDPRWSQYFSPQGLKKDQIYNFANDRNVTLLSFYEGLSLIPYFRDANGRNIFIETVINQDTDRTGLFCAFNADLFETDYPNGLVDLIGNNLVGSTASSINFLSYNDVIMETVAFTNTYLDRPGNVAAIDGTSPSISVRDGFVDDGSRTGWFAEGFVAGVTFDSLSFTASAIDFTYGVSDVLGGPVVGSTSSYAIIGGDRVNVAGTASFELVPSAYPSNGTFSSVIVLDSTGNITKVDNIINSTNPSVTATDIVLGYLTVGVSSGSFVTYSFNHVTVDNTGYKELTFGTGSNDYFISNVGTSTNVSLKFEFNDTASTPTTSNYDRYRRIKLFNYLITLLNSSNKDKMAMVYDFSTFEKASLEGMSITNIVTSTSANKSFTIQNTGLSETELQDVLDGNFVLYSIDDEFIVGEETITTRNSAFNPSSPTDGVVAKYSQFYIRYNDGVINTGDYFYSNYLSETIDEVEFITSNGMNYVRFYAPSVTSSWPINPLAIFGDSFIVPSSVVNNGMIVVSNSTPATASGGEYWFEVAQNLNNEVLQNVSVIWNGSKKHYLQMYFDNSNILNVAFMDSTLSTAEPIDNLSSNTTINIQSNRTNYKQTIEIEVPAGYTQVPNKILVKGTRYTEIKVGDFLEAYVDTATLVTGQVPKKLTRILSKKLYAADTSLVEISCDARINKSTYGPSGDLQTTRYTSIEDYVTTYKAISLKGFRIREASMPDGTEERQNAMLNLVGKGTPLFRAITNKEALDFRYLVDSFGLGLTERSKQQLVDICGERLDAFGFINMPSMKSFKNSSSPSFLQDGVLSIEFVSKGGDPESNPAFLYSFGEGRGTTTVGYFAPYLTVNDGGRPTDVPPAMFVATTYMRKQITNVTSIVPWTIAAGTTNGRITGIAGIEMDFTPQDIEWLNQAQMNPIVFKRNRGYIIETENTAQTLYKSALSYIHVREVLIELERELSRMLLDFQWKFNTAEIRAEIKLRADIICEQYVNRQGLYNYFNKCDEENNTPEIIDNQIGVLDTYVEPIKGMGVIVNNVTILRTGAIQSGGFIS